MAIAPIVISIVAATPIRDRAIGMPNIIASRSDKSAWPAEALPRSRDAGGGVAVVVPLARYVYQQRPE